MLKSKGVAETVAGGLLSLVDPTGISGDAVKKGIDTAITKIADEFDTRKLSELESDRVKDVMVLAIKKIENNLSDGKKLRDDTIWHIYYYYYYYYGDDITFRQKVLGIGVYN